MNTTQPYSIFRPAGAHFEPATGICWHTNGGRREQCDNAHAEQAHFAYGRCRSGRRWFWMVTVPWWAPQYCDDEDRHEKGKADTEEQAEAAVRAILVRMAAGKSAVAALHHDLARYHLKKLNKEKRAARPPPENTDSRVVDYLYGLSIGGEDLEREPVRFRITKIVGDHRLAG